MGVTILFTLNYRNLLLRASNWVAGSKDWWNVPRHILAFGRDPGRTDAMCGGREAESRAKAGVHLLSDHRGPRRGWWEPLGDSIYYRARPRLRHGGRAGEVGEAARRDYLRQS